MGWVQYTDDWITGWIRYTIGLERGVLQSNPGIVFYLFTKFFLKDVSYIRPYKHKMSSFTRQDNGWWTRVENKINKTYKIYMNFIPQSSLK